MSESNPFLAGVVEGFYGRPWTRDTRLAYAGHLASLGLNTCLYCPKSDPWLRKRWREHWPEHEWRALGELAQAYRDVGLMWGPGLSPYALYQDYGKQARSQLHEKVQRLLELGPGLLAVLFDDMPGELSDLAGRQLEIIADVRQWAPDLPLLVCPTYYSFDPVLETHFGARPHGYWEQFGAELPEGVAVMWTGNRVCAESISMDDIARIATRINAPLALWDNYPVNDGALRSRFLYCQKLAARSPQLREVLYGHLCNPMNQGLASLPALLGLAEMYGAPPDENDWLEEVLGKATWQRLRRDRSEFREVGLDGMEEERREQLALAYAALPGTAAAEVAAWLRGEYTFDPACLTD